jgi:tRNA(fMet)-specific endonuclease VapC
VRYLLDTNIVSDLVRNPQGRVASTIAKYGEGAVATSIIVAAELRYGAAKRNSARLSAQLETILSAVQVIPVEAPADTTYGFIRVALEAKGHTYSSPRRRWPLTRCLSPTTNGNLLV